MNAPTAYPLAWPPGQARTEKRLKSQFKVSLNRALADLEDALRLFGNDTGKPVRGIVISSNVTLGVNRPADPGVAVYFEWDGAQRVIAIDRYQRIEENVRAVFCVLEGRRQEMRHGGLSIVRAAFKGFEALPPPRDWRAVLRLGPDARLADAEAAYRDLAKKAHPDSGGSDAAMAELNEARAAARRELAA